MASIWRWKLPETAAFSIGTSETERYVPARPAARAASTWEYTPEFYVVHPLEIA